MADHLLPILALPALSMSWRRGGRCRRGRSPTCRLSRFRTKFSFSMGDVMFTHSASCCLNCWPVSHHFRQKTSRSCESKFFSDNPNDSGTLIRRFQRNLIPFVRRLLPSIPVIASKRPWNWQTICERGSNRPSYVAEDGCGCSLDSLRFLLSLRDWSFRQCDPTKD